MTDQTFLALSAHVLRAADGTDCTNNGISALNETLHIVGYFQQHTTQVYPLPEGVPFELEHINAPVLACRKDSMGNTKTVHLVPAQWDKDTETWQPAPEWHMAGGNFAHTSDSRFTRLISDMIDGHFYGAVAIHDRTERRRCFDTGGLD